MAEKQEQYLSRKQVEDVLAFSEALYLASNGYYSPFIQNQLLNNLNNNPNVPTMDKLEKALADYKNSAEDIGSYMQFMEKWDMIFARTLKSYANILAFDLQITCKNAFTDEEYKSEEYKKDKDKINKFLDAFDYKAEFQRVVEQIMRNETGYYWFRKTKWGNKGMKATLQLMPQQYCLLTDYWEKGLLYDSY